MPFGEIYTPTPARRRSIQLQFTPLTPIRETPRRLSISPPSLPISNRTLGIGTVVFLIVSAIYKSGVIGLILRSRSAEIPSYLIIDTAAPVKVENSPVTEVLQPVSPVLPSFEVAKLASRVAQLEDREAAYVSNCNIQQKTAEAEILLLRDKVDKCSSDMKYLEKMKKKSALECNETLGQLEIEQIQVIEKVEADFAKRLDNLLMKTNSETEGLSVQLEALKKENSLLQGRLEVAAQEKTMTFLEAIEKVRTGDTPRDPLLSVGRQDSSDQLERLVVWILSAVILVLFGVCMHLWRGRKLEREEIPTTQLEEVSLIEVLPTDPEEQERIALAVEDMRASIAREVHAQIEMIEVHHEREMSIMKAIVEETRKSSVEISSLMKEVVDETCAVSTTAHNSPRSSTSSCLDLSRDTPDISSLSVMLETGVTPIRVPLRDKLSVNNNKPSPSAPTCYSIASPSRKLVHQSSFDSSSSSDEWSDQEDGENEGHNAVMANIWSNFASKPRRI